MTLIFPHTFDDTEPVTGQNLQDALDIIAEQFPVSVANLGAFQFGTLAAVNADAGGWCNYSLPVAYATQIDAVLAQNTWAGTSNANFQVVQVNAGGSVKKDFRAFVGTAGLNCSCGYIAIGH